MSKPKHENRVGVCIVLALLGAWAIIGGAPVAFATINNVQIAALFVVLVIVLLFVSFIIFPEGKS